MRSDEAGALTGHGAPSAAKILVVEDRALVAAKIERDLQDAGFEVVGLAATVSASLDRLDMLDAGLDAAVLDIDLRGEPVYPVAERLRARRVPFLFLTGYGQQAIGSAWSDVPRIEKPFDAGELVRRLEDLLSDRVAHAEPRPSGALTPAIRRAWDNLRHSRDIVTEARAFQEIYDLTRPTKRS